MTVTPYSLAATYQPISIFKIQERRIKLIRKASRSICQTTRCHTPNYRHRGEHHNSHNAEPALQSTGRGPTALVGAADRRNSTRVILCSKWQAGTRAEHAETAKLLSVLCLQGVSPWSDVDRPPALQTLRKVFSSKRSRPWPFSQTSRSTIH